eukprot:4565382-Karenia_brevis.AAC.1
MALANDNFFGCKSAIIYKYKVRWIEAAMVCPSWTNMIIYYVEGDQGHLMNEEMGQHKLLVAARGSCVSYQIPWEEILSQMNKHRAD